MKTRQIWFSKAASILLLPQVTILILFPFSTVLCSSFTFDCCLISPALYVTPSSPWGSFLKVNHISFKVRPNSLSLASASLTYLQIWQRGDFLRCFSQMWSQTELSPLLFNVFLFCLLKSVSFPLLYTKSVPWDFVLRTSSAPSLSSLSWITLTGVRTAVHGWQLFCPRHR